jgi:hypothetical protein
MLKNTNDLKNALLEEVSKIREGTSTPEQANAVSNTVGKFLSTVRLEMEYARMLGKRPNIKEVSVYKED